MNFKNTIDNKRIFQRPDGEVLLDLTQQNFNPKASITVVDVVRVSRDFEMRPDLVAKFAYSNTDATELILKQSGISNPFTLQEGDLIFLQELRTIESQFSSATKKDAQRIVRNQYIDASKTSEIDDNLKKFEKRERVKRKVSNPSQPALPPNFANPGDQEIKLRGGKVIYGENVTQNTELTYDKPLSKSEFLSRLIKKRLIDDQN